MKTLGESKLISVANTTTAYSAGDVIGSLLKVDVSNGQQFGDSVFLQHLSVIDESAAGKKLTVLIFDDVIIPAADNAAFAPSAADLKKLVKEIDISTWSTYNSMTVAYAEDLNALIPTDQNRPFYILLLAGESITFGSANKLTVKPSYYID